MPNVTCPGCGEDEDLRGQQTSGGITITCGRCGVTFERNTTPTCALCGSTDLQAVPTSTLREAGRGDQWAPSGVRIAWYCWVCSGHDVTSPNPEPGPNPPPGDPSDRRDLRQR